MTGFQSHVLLFFSTILSIIGLFAFDMYLPAMREIQQFYSTSEYYAGLSASIYLIGFAFAQLFYGALSDQVGRKPSLIIGLIIFLLGTIGCIQSTSITVFLCFRFIQAIGVCAAYILWQPIILDLYSEERVKVIFTRLMALGAISPAVAPFIGGKLTSLYQWQSVFVLLAAITVILLFWSIFIFQETLEKKEEREKFSIGKLMQDYRSVALDRVFIGISLGISLVITCYLVYLTIAPFLLSSLGYSTEQIGFTYFPIAFSFFLGAEVAKRLTLQIGSEGVIKLGIFVSVAGSVVIAIRPLISPLDNLLEILLPICLLAFGNSFVVPTGSAFLMQRFQHISGTCASALGFSIAFLAFFSTALASFWVEGFRGQTLTLILLPCALLAILSCKYGLRQHELLLE